MSVHRGDAWSGGACSQGVSAPGGGSALGGLLPGGCLLLGGKMVPGGCLVEIPPMATAVGGTHPTGMHSCFTKFSEKLHEI